MNNINTNHILIILLYQIQQMNTRLDRIEASIIDILEQDTTWLYSRSQEVENDLIKTNTN